MFKSTLINLGTVSVGSKNTMEFYYENIKQIDKVTTPCGCSTTKHDVRGKKIIVEYIAQPIPVHLTMEGQTSQNKKLSVEVNYMDTNNVSKVENLTFIATVIQ